MDGSQDELLKKLNELQAARGIDDDTRKVIGLLGETIGTLGEEIDDLQERVEELEETVDMHERREEKQRKQAWYSER